MANPLLYFDPELFERYLDGRCAPAERAAFEAAAAADPRISVAVEAVRALSAGPYTARGSVDGQAAWDVLLRRVLGRDQTSGAYGRLGARRAGWGESAVPRGVRGVGYLVEGTLRNGSFAGDTLRAGASSAHTLRGGSSPKRSAVRWALGATLAVGLAGIAVLGTHSNGRQGPNESMPVHTYLTNRSQQATITLRDGSRVTLAPESRLVVATGFGSRARTLELHGQAHFDITTARGAPFEVRAGAIAVRVLGTAFDVRHYTTDQSVQVAVVTGKVAVTAARTVLTLTAGKTAQISDSTASVTATDDLKRYTSWMQGTLIFDGTPVPEMLAALSRWYGYDFRLSDSTLVRQRVRAEFHTTAPEETLALIKDVLNVSLTFDGTTVTLHPLRTGASAPTRQRAGEFQTTPREVGK